MHVRKQVFDLSAWSAPRLVIPSFRVSLFSLSTIQRLAALPCMSFMSKFGTMEMTVLLVLPIRGSIATCYIASLSPCPPAVLSYKATDPHDLQSTTRVRYSSEEHVPSAHFESLRDDPFIALSHVPKRRRMQTAFCGAAWPHFADYRADQGQTKRQMQSCTATICES